MKIRMLEERVGSPDGHIVKRYYKDAEYDIPDSLAADFINRGHATEVNDDNK